VLHPFMVKGGRDNELGVPKALEPLVRDTGEITVTGASVNAFRWYRLSRSAGQVVGTVASIIGALLVGLGTASPTSDTGKGLLIAGTAVTMVAVLTVVISAFRAPV
jgi:hypothetical protein